MKQEELKRRLLEGMCYVAEHADAIRGREVSSKSVEFKPFHPGIADKLIFNQIIDEYMQDFIEEMGSCYYRSDIKTPALSLLNLFYAKYLPEEERVSPREVEWRVWEVRAK